MGRAYTGWRVNAEDRRRKEAYIKEHKEEHKGRANIRHKEGHTQY